MNDSLDALGGFLNGGPAPGWSFLVAAGALVLLLAAVRISTERSRLTAIVIRAAAWVEVGAIALLLVSMVALGILQIVLRNVLSTGFVWIDPLLRHEVLWIGLLGAAYATAHDRHISVDALSRFLRGAAARAVHTSVELLAAVVSLLLANATYALIRDEHASGSTAFLSIPTWSLMLVMPFAFTVMSYRFLLGAWRGRRREPGGATAAPAGEPANLAAGGSVTDRDARAGGTP
jgi:TRAP-type C4-dicarboxylate transport system permease small subunit